eukprot:Colp12_sorted_trinity150504_noHs@29804
MSRFVRASKFRHVFGQPYKKEQTYDNVRLTRSAWDSNNCAVNCTFIAVILEAAGGGSFLVLPLDKFGKVDPSEPKVSGHKSAVVDVAWNPFNEHIVASGSEDCTVKIWQIPAGGLTEDLTVPVVDLVGHQRKIGHVVWHPTANNILASTSFDLTIKLWNIATAECVRTIEGHLDTIYSLSFNYEGNKFATISKDKKIRVFESHSGKLLTEGNGHDGSKTSRVVFLKNDRLFSAGFSKMSERQFALWDANNLDQAIKMEVIDTSAGNMMIFYDGDLDMVYLAGKGDGNIRYFEVVDEAPYVHYLSEYKSATPQRGFGQLPKRGCKVNECEIQRFYKLHPTGLVEPISFIVPRKSDMFQDDLFPPTIGDIPSLTPEEFLSGKVGTPKTINLKDGFVPSGKPEFVAPPVKEAPKDVTENPQNEKELREAFHKLKSRVEQLEKELATKDVTIRQLQQQLGK